ncbi:heat shock 70 kDa protein II-like [Frankliniella occidentalis]|uniref:Heat shock 70 kDa protein II-like n=1 Tax=Frankliniella occidentalis TaxID=133901 RepID=A0A6J1T907_FRAOC|nr:heat shock 70 kDa protein II-like [Frankliniella occidentalis]
MAHPRATAIGIDLGTTYSCVAVVLNGKVEVVANEVGQRTTASVVGFLDGEVEELVGEAAASHSCPENVVWDAKRMVGRTFSHKTVQADLPRWPFSVVQGEKDKIRIRVTHNDAEKEFSPEEISSKVVKKMKAVAEAYLGYRVNQAVITVPAYFNSTQRDATRKAGALAGLTVHRTVPEPSAAALAYAMQQMKPNVTKRILVYDLGGGTFDVTVASVRGCHVQVRAVGGDCHLGGQDFDQRIFDHVAKEVEKKTGRNIVSNTRKARRLLTMCERLKQDLSAMMRAEIDMLPLIGEDLSITLTRAKLEDLLKDLLTRTRDIIKDVLNSIEMKADVIDEVVLVGGSTRMPAVHRLLAELFPGKNINKSLNPDEAVAYGAAALAARLTGDRTSYLAGILVNDVTPISFGLGEEDGGVSILIPRNTPIPYSCEKFYVTVYDNQDSLSLKIYQGERSIASRNTFIGEYCVDNLPPVKAGLEVEMKLSIDKDGVLTVQAKHPVTKAWGGCPIQTVDCTTFSEQVTTGTVEDTAAGADDSADDKAELARLRARFRLAKFLHNLSDRQELASSVRTEIGVAEAWMSRGQYTRIEYVKKLGELRRLFPGSGRKAAVIATQKFITRS